MNENVLKKILCLSAILSIASGLKGCYNQADSSLKESDFEWDLSASDEEHASFIPTDGVFTAFIDGTETKMKRIDGGSVGDVLAMVDHEGNPQREFIIKIPHDIPAHQSLFQSEVKFFKKAQEDTSSIQPYVIPSSSVSVEIEGETIQGLKKSFVVGRTLQEYGLSKILTLKNPTPNQQKIISGAKALFDALRKDVLGGLNYKDLHDENIMIDHRGQLRIVDGLIVEATSQDRDQVFKTECDDWYWCARVRDYTLEVESPLCQAHEPKDIPVDDYQNAVQTIANDQLYNHTRFEATLGEQPLPLLQGDIVTHDQVSIALFFVKNSGQATLVASGHYADQNGIILDWISTEGVGIVNQRHEPAHWYPGEFVTPLAEEDELDSPAECINP